MKKKLLLFIGGLFTLSAFWYTSCMLEYGYGAMENLNGNCVCMSGYTWWTDFLWKDKCISVETYCTDKYGYGATYDYLKDSCKCRLWYVFSDSIYWGQQCVIGSTVCYNKYWYGSEYNSLDSTCGCSTWYMWGTDILWSETCVYWATECRQKYGQYAEFNSYDKSCECKSGYIFDDTTKQCREKSNSAYFLLEEYDDDDNKAIVYSSYTSKRYLLELRYTMSLYRAEDFIWKNIVINMGTDFSVDRWDKFVLNNETRTTDIAVDITSVESIDDSYTLKSCEDIYGENVEEAYNNKCVCGEWYKWNNSKDACIDDSWDSEVVYENPVSDSIYWNGFPWSSASYNLLLFQRSGAIIANMWLINLHENLSDYEVLTPILRQELIGIVLKLKWIKLPDDYICRNLFKDVSSSKPNNWVCRVAEIARDNGIISSSNSNFNPQKNVSISEALSMVLNARGLQYEWFYSEGNKFYPNTQEWQKSVLAYAKYYRMIDSTYIDPNMPAKRGNIFFDIIVAPPN